MTLKQQIIASALTKHPTMPTRTLSRLIWEQEGGSLIWPSLNAIRLTIRIARGIVRWQYTVIAGAFAGQKLVFPSEKVHARARALIKRFPRAPNSSIGRMLVAEFPHLKPDSGRTVVRDIKRKTHQ